MKKILFFVAILFLAVSCNKDAIVSENIASGECVTISAKISSETSRTVGDGKTVNRCILEVYNSEDNSLIGERLVTSMTAGSAQFSVKLESGLACKFVLWADYSADGSNDKFYNTGDGLQNITRITGEYTGNNDQLDAFYACKEFTVGETTVNVEMKRPFAQLNVYSSDFDDLLDLQDKPTKVSVSFSSVYTSFNALTGVATGDAELQYVVPVGIIGSNGQMSYDYLFASADEQTLANFTMSFSNESGTAFEPYEFSSIPLQRNYRTHVTGNLLTNSTKLNIVVEPDFETPDYSIDVYDGFSVEKPKIIGNEANVNSAANMVYVLKNMGTSNLSSVKTVNINRDIDFADAEIENSTAQSEISINGNSRTIKNLTLKGNVGNRDACALIPCLTGGTISNLNLDKILIKCEGSIIPNFSNFYAGVIVGKTYGTVVIENCNVTNSEVNGVNKVGAIVGFAAENNIKVANCTVKNTKVVGHSLDGGDCGGIVGYIASPITSATISGNKFINSTVEIEKLDDSMSGILQLLNGYIDIQKYDPPVEIPLVGGIKTGRGASLYVGTCQFSNQTITISADNDALEGSRRIIRGVEDGGLVRYQGLLGNIRDADLKSGTLFINGDEATVDLSSEKKPVQ